ncbi:MAG: translation elongation factor Ts [Candidatus Doudnabacteria bacterium RIFCSPLOWO2_01_FULL_44_21]|uniref:Elongation factor Ts n=1 Tax=Candidatus Doudnabacteria bacterium RIFCSPLOWO2_01_FULL_44_21 TaxID=1817841 RepID=A0A1F5PYQ8_9BACT|nr:MAG: translation elongation factor Ts [Candidatus Doudnabacteria bacterium RIFCSPHIGHO2_02_FULL_43_13b]OGE94720.1 MAG: translation elongation factor Ts [Candidatus Doudnabacteria bacterium RIFCSPLOWO2_01_FULL_44_21]
MQFTQHDIKKLREMTGAGVMDAKKALQEAGSFDDAIALLRKQGHASLSKKSTRSAKQGIVVSYIHAGGKIGALLELNCETDFVARNDEFIKLANEIVLHIAAMGPADTEELLAQPYVRETEKKIQDLIAETVGKLGENIQVGRFTRFVLGGE